MRHISKALLAAAAVTFGVAHAAPSFGGSGMRFGGDHVERTKAKETRAADSILRSLRNALKFEKSSKAAPVSDDSYDAAAREKCDKENQTEVARVESKDEKGGEASSKKKARGGEPVYLAF